MKKVFFWLLLIVIAFLLIYVKQHPNTYVGGYETNRGDSFRSNFGSDKILMNEIIEGGEWHVDHDEFQDVVFVRHDFNLYENFIQMYLVSKNTNEDEGINDLRMVVNYYGQDWVFWDEITFLVDGKRFEFDYSILETHRDANGGTVSEYFDVSIQDEKNFLDRIESCVSIKYRLSGSKWYERELTRKEIDDLKDMIKLYKLVESNQFFIGSLDD